MFLVLAGTPLQKHRLFCNSCHLFSLMDTFLTAYAHICRWKKNNDAGYILSFHRDLTEWFSEGYVWVVDCGFRDVFDVFEGLGLETKMPTFLKRCLS